MKLLCRLLLLIAYLCAAAFAGWATPSLPRSPGRITITLDGDQLTYSASGKKVEAHGHVRIKAEASHISSTPVTITAGDVTADLATGEFSAKRGVSVQTREGEMTGESLEYSAHADQFTLTRAKCAVPIRELPETGSVIRAYAFGEKITREAEVVYVIQGRVTTCDRDDPHWSVSARRIVFDPQHDCVKIERPTIQLEGLRIPIPGSFSRKISTQKDVSDSILTFPGYSSRDGLYASYYLQFGQTQGHLQTDFDFRFTQRRGFRGVLHSERSSYPWQFDLFASREEYPVLRLQNFLAINRKPEFSVTRYLRRPDDPESRLSLTAKAGRYDEEDVDLETATFTPPTVTKSRFALIGQYTDKATAQDRHVGQWWGLSAAKYWYDGGNSYHDLSLSLGAGVKLGEKSRISATVIRHVEGGFSPFIMDRVEIPTEVRPYFDLRLAPKWDFEGYGRYDWNASRLRDYEFKLRRINHCISWVAKYRSTGHHFAVGVELNGLNNDLPDYQPKALIPPVLSGGQPAPAAVPSPTPAPAPK